MLVAGGVRWWLAPGVDPGDARALAERAMAAFASERPWKRGRRKALYRLTRDGDAQTWLLKVSEPGALAPLRRLGASRARRSLAIAARLAAAGVATPPPIAAGELRRGGLLVRSFELLPWLPDAIDLARFRADAARPAAERRAAAVALGTLARALHDAGVDQDDLAPNNFLWRSAAGATLLAVDFERARARDRVPPAARWRALAKLDRYCAGESAASRMRVLRAYCGDDRVASRDAARAIEAAAAALLADDARRWTRVAKRSKRRFEPLDDAGLCGWVRRGADRGALLGALRGEPSGDWIVAPLPARDRRATARALGLALALAQRDLAPRPDACVFDDGGARVAFERPPGAGRLDARTSCAALVVAIDRLLALGALPTDVAPAAFAVAPTHDRVWLLTPTAARVPAWLGPGRRAEARCVADRLARSLD